ncbi:keratin, type I cytoskeletal 13-like protein [Lates japonicus]|uniref:Keratin, type I cytoskeletal 13-like protein n=1 Tax=Lates japonicus TaxID=270547 RepID=A0AAD3NP74_LATJO|nr:keratin, type I cytoskeletal 13-like protein [Lates japonicus]
MERQAKSTKCCLTSRHRLEMEIAEYKRLLKRRGSVGLHRSSYTSTTKVLVVTEELRDGTETSSTTTT